MIYGLYLSAMGVLTNSYRQDVIANNLANSETVGFKRSLALYQQRRTQAAETGQTDMTDRRLEPIGGGIVSLPTMIDHSQGSLEQSDGALNLAINGDGFFAVQTPSGTRLTRNGRLMIDREGFLSTSDDGGHHVLDDQNNPIDLKGIVSSELTIRPDGTMTADGKPLARLGLFDVPDKTQLTQHGGTLLDYPDMKKLTAGSGQIESGYIENSNVDPMTEMAQLINCQRTLESNASMIRFQDQTLGRAVNDVGKIS